MEPKETSRNFYAAVWRWHFYAGLLVVPVMVVLAVTGIVYLFKPQLDAFMYRDLMFVANGSPRVTPDEMASTVLNSYDGAKILRFRPNREQGRSAEFDASVPDGRELRIFVDPSSNRVLGAIDNRNNLQYYAFEVHGKLMSGRPGEWIIELAVSWGVVLLATGVYLWWPRGGRGFGNGVLIPRLGGFGTRTFWRDLHATVGFYGLILVAFMFATGLPWCDFWGKNVLRARSYYPLAGKPKPRSERPSMETLNGPGEKSVPWAVEDLPIATSEDEHAAHRHEAMATNARIDGDGQGITFSDADRIAVENNGPEDCVITPPSEPDGVYAVTAFPSDPRLQTTLHIDRYSGRVINAVRWKDYGAMPKTVEMGIALHEGKFFGFPNQLLMLVAALAVLALAASGVAMWWKRRPQGKIGVPPFPGSVPHLRWVVVATLVFGIVFPILGASLIAALIMDFAVVGRVPALREFFY